MHPGWWGQLGPSRVLPYQYAQWYPRSWWDPGSAEFIYHYPLLDEGWALCILVVHDARSLRGSVHERLDGTGGGGLLACCCGVVA